MTETDWGAFGACESCGSVPGWPCHRGKRQLKNPHPGRPVTGREPFVDSFAGTTAAEYQEHLAGREVVDAVSAEVWDLAREGPWDPQREVAEALTEHGLPVPDPVPLKTTETWGPAREGPRGRGPWNLTTTETTKEDSVAGQSYTLENAEQYPANPTGRRRVDAEIPKDIERDQWDRPKLVRAELVDGAWQISSTGEVEGYTRASTLGSALESQEGLSIWRGGMIVYGMSRRRDLVLAGQAIPGTEDKKLHRRPLYRIADQAKEAAEASSAATIGTALHALTEQADRGQLAVDIGEYQSVLDIYLERMAGWKIVRSETFVVSDYFHAAGSFDRLITPLEPMALVDQLTGEIITVIMPGDLIVVDLKTSTTADYFGAKFFAQLAVYVTGQEYDRDRESPTYGARIPLGQRTDFALILHIPQGGDADGAPVATWQWLDMRVGIALAQLACVNLETRKKRFTRTHMREVQVQPHTPTGTGPIIAPTRVPLELPARDPLGSQHLAQASGLIAAAGSFPDAQADLVDAELEENGAMPEKRTASPAALVGINLGTDDRAPQEDPGIELRRECPDHGEYQYFPDAQSGECPDCAAREAAVPGPEETAPLPDGWESRAEQDLAAEATTSVPKAIGPSLQEAAARRKVEDTLIRKIREATVLKGERDSLLDLYERASAAGAWSERVKAAASVRRAELERRAVG